MDDIDPIYALLLGTRLVAYRLEQACNRWNSTLIHWFRIGLAVVLMLCVNTSTQGGEEPDLTPYWDAIEAALEEGDHDEAFSQLVRIRYSFPRSTILESAEQRHGQLEKQNHDALVIGDWDALDALHYRVDLYRPGGILADIFELHPDDP